MSFAIGTVSYDKTFLATTVTTKSSYLPVSIRDSSKLLVHLDVDWISLPIKYRVSQK